MFEPDQAAMLEMVSHLFGDQMSGLVELAWTDTLKPHPATASCIRSTNSRKWSSRAPR
jgi:hypothetical protein